MNRSALFDLTGRKALVTGASRGIGRAIAQGLADAGAKVAVTARGVEGLNTLCADIIARGGEAQAIVADLGDGDAPEEVVRRAAEGLGGIDILVSNAGIDTELSALKFPIAEWRRISQFNTEVPFRLARASEPLLRTAGGGKIVLVASILSLVAVRNDSAYIASKHALLGVTRALALEWGRRNIQVNAIAPGFIRTEMTRGTWESEAGEAAMLERTPANRLGEPEDIAGAAVFLASAASNFVTGQALVVDGGWCAQ